MFCNPLYLVIRMLGGASWTIGITDSMSGVLTSFWIVGAR
jgi:hypothetical protein